MEEIDEKDVIRGDMDIPFDEWIKLVESTL